MYLHWRFAAITRWRHCSPSALVKETIYGCQDVYPAGQTKEFGPNPLPPAPPGHHQPMTCHAPLPRLAQTALAVADRYRALRLRPPTASLQDVAAGSGPARTRFTEAEPCHSHAQPAEARTRWDGGLRQPSSVVTSAAPRAPRGEVRASRTSREVSTQIDNTRRPSTACVEDTHPSSPQMPRHPRVGQPSKPIDLQAPTFGHAEKRAGFETAARTVR